MAAAVNHTLASAVQQATAVAQRVNLTHGGSGGGVAPEGDEGGAAAAAAAAAQAQVSLFYIIYIYIYSYRSAL